MPAPSWPRLSIPRVINKKKSVLVPCPTCNSMSHKLSTKLTKCAKESIRRLEVDNQTETGPCLSSSSIPRRRDASRDSIHLPWFRTSTGQKRALSARMPVLITKAGADSLSKWIFLPIGDHSKQSSKSIFSTMTPSHVTVNGRRASISIRLPWSKGLGLESAIFAVFRAGRPEWKGTRRKN